MQRRTLQRCSILAVQSRFALAGPLSLLSLSLSRSLPNIPHDASRAVIKRERRRARRGRKSYYMRYTGFSNIFAKGCDNGPRFSWPFAQVVPPAIGECGSDGICFGTLYPLTPPPTTQATLMAMKAPTARPASLARPLALPFSLQSK